MGPTFIQRRKDRECVRAQAWRCTASMGPTFIQRRKADNVPVLDRPPFGFNGADVYSTSESPPVFFDEVPVGELQWGRRLFNVGKMASEFVYHVSIKASMGPTFIQRRKAITEPLRPQALAFASMGPTFIQRRKAA